jgi:tetratricopeptide (TPR) repeat protein
MSNPHQDGRETQSLQAFRREDVSSVAEEYESCLRLKQGKVIFLSGVEGVGKTVLAAQCVRLLSRHTSKPMILVGHFSDVPYEGKLIGWKLREHRLSLSTVLTGLGQVVSTFAAGATVAAAPQFATALVALAGQTAQAAGFGAGELRKQNTSAQQQSIDAHQLINLIGQLVRQDKPIIVCLDDLHLAKPVLEWTRLFFRALLPPLLNQYPLLLIVTTVQEDSTTVGRSEQDEVMAEMEAEGLGVRRTLNALDCPDIESWLGTVDNALTNDLLVCTGGNPGWVARMFEQWLTEGSIARERGLWRYTSDGRYAARITAGDAVRKKLWDLAGGEFEAYEQLVTLLRLAALEGMVFTAPVLARALDQSVDSLVSYIDGRLVNAAGELGRPLRKSVEEAADNSEYIDATGPIVKYRFSSRLLWLVLHPKYSRDQWSPNPTLEAQARIYAEALIEVCGARVAAVARLLSTLLLWAGDEAAARHYAGLHDHAADVNVYAAVALADERSAYDASRRGDTWPMSIVLSTAKRLVRAGDVLSGRVSKEEDTRAYQYAFILANHAIDRGAENTGDVLRVKASALSGVARIAMTKQQWGDAARYSLEAAEIRQGLGSTTSGVTERLFAASALCALVLSLEQRREDVYLFAAQAHCTIAAPTPAQLSFLDSGLKDTLDITLLKRTTQRIFEDSLAAINSVESGQRTGLWASYLICRSRFEQACGRRGNAVTYLTRAIGLMPEGRRSDLGEAYFQLGQNLRCEGLWGKAEPAFRESLRLRIKKGDMPKIAHILYELSLCLSRNDKDDEAKVIAAHAVVLCAEYGLIPIAATCWDLLTDMFAASGSDSVARRCNALADEANMALGGDVDLAAGSLMGEEDRDYAARAWRDGMGATAAQDLFGVNLGNTQSFLAAQGLARTPVPPSSVRQPMLIGELVDAWPDEPIDTSGG